MEEWKERHAPESRCDETMEPKPEPAELPATAPWLLHSLRTVFDARRNNLLEEARLACVRDSQDRVQVKFMHRCLEVTAVYDRNTERFTELRACDAGEGDWEEPSYCITMSLRQVAEE